MRILLADDHTLVRESLKVFVEKLAPGAEVLEASTFDEALALADATSGIDMVLLDLRMPGMNGLGGLETMRTRHPDVPVAIISGTSLKRSDIEAAIGRGAAGFIPKSIGGKAMLNALQLILSGECYVPSMVLIDAQDGDEPPDGMGMGENPLSLLTKRERDVIELLIEGHSNKVIANSLGLQEITVKVHLKSIFRKLGVSNRTQAVTTALQHRRG